MLHGAERRAVALHLWHLIQEVTPVNTADTRHNQTVADALRLVLVTVPSLLTPERPENSGTDT